MRYTTLMAAIAFVLCSCEAASSTPPADANSGDPSSAGSLKASSEKVDPAKYEGAIAAIALGIGKHEGQFYRTVIWNDIVSYMSMVNRNTRNGTALAWDVMVRKQPYDGEKMYVSLWHYDCRARTSVELHNMAITEAGEITRTSTPYFQAVPNIVGTGGDEMLKFACGEESSALPIKDLLIDADRFFSIAD